MSRAKRQQFLNLTAASGSVPNLELALEAIGCPPEAAAIQAAAAAGRVGTYQVLVECSLISSDALAAAARAGQRTFCDWLLDRRCSWFLDKAAYSAAEGGHVELMDSLLAKARMDPRIGVDKRLLLVAAAQGCDLSTLKRLHHEWGVGQQEQQQQAEQQQQQQAQAPLGADGGIALAAAPAAPALGPAAVEFPAWQEAESKKQIMAAAAASGTADWQAKVEWLEGLGYPLSRSASDAVAARPDGASRLQWLRLRGFPMGYDVTHVAVRSGSLIILEYLHAAGIAATTDTLIHEAAKHGHAHIVTWVLGLPGGHARLSAQLFCSAAQSGNFGLMSLLKERGCPMGRGGAAFAAAAEAGNQEALEWLLAQGCSMGDDGAPYVRAMGTRDMLTLRFLRRLGCPWGPPGRVFEQSMGSELRLLRWLLVEGCPLDRIKTKAAVRASNHFRSGDVLALLEEHWQQRL